MEPEKPAVPAVPAAPAAPAKAKGDNPFGMNRADGLRTWSDSTGQYQLEARLISVRNDVVRLCNAQGKYFRIAIDRLSAADQDFVRSQTQVATAW
jgi:hypothetical protein